MKKLVLLFLFLSLNCLSQETILDCSGTFYRKSLSAKITIVPLTGGGEQQNTFQVYFDEQKNTIHFNDFSLCELYKHYGGKFYEGHEINKKIISYKCGVSGFSNDKLEKNTDRLEINRVTGEFHTRGKMENSDGIVIIGSNGTCKKASNQF
jgi:hypothetical protein